MRVLADSHAIIWHMQGSSRLSATAGSALVEAEATEGVVVSVATLVNLWYVIQTTKKLSYDDLERLRDKFAFSPALIFQPVDVAVADATVSIPRDLLADPWDRFIVGTALALSVPLVTRDRVIRDSDLVTTVW